MKLKSKSRLRSFLTSFRPAITDFRESSLPWIDRADSDISSFLGNYRGDRTANYDLVEKLNHWRINGYVILEQAIPTQLVDEFLADLDRIIDNKDNIDLSVDTWRPEYLNARIQKIKDLAPEILRGSMLKFLMTHEVSEPARKMMNHAEIMIFLNAVFDDQAVAKQSLTFRYGSQQRMHSDYAYVVPSIPSHLAASWIALEDIQPGSGPLIYYEGSHKIPVFDFGGQTFLNDSAEKTDDEFLDYLEAQCTKRGLSKKTLLIKKGDVLIWHAALVHGGEPIIVPDLTRQSHVTHYTSSKAAQKRGHV